MTNPVQQYDPLPPSVKKQLDYDLEQLKDVPLTYAATAYRGEGTSNYRH